MKTRILVKIQLRESDNLFVQDIQHSFRKTIQLYGKLTEGFLLRASLIFKNSSFAWALNMSPRHMLNIKMNFNILSLKLYFRTHLLTATLLSTNVYKKLLQYRVWKSDQYRCHLTKANVLYSNTGILASTESAVNDLFTNDKLKCSP